MAGRKDYEERKEKKLERYLELSQKANKRSKEYLKKHDKIANTIPFGQPILVGHHSESRYRNDIKKMDNDIRKSIAEDKKANYYEDKIKSIESNTSISSDDPNVIKKLEQKIVRLEEQKKKVKSREHEWYELPYINKEIKRIKNRIKEIKELEELDFKDIIFNGGKVIHNKEINRIQFIFDSIPDEEIRIVLKRRGFKWSRYEKAWQRLYNKNGITATNWVLEEIGHKQ